MEGLVFRERHHVFGVLLVPLGDQFIAGLADVFTVEDRAGEYAGDVQTVAEGGVGAVLQVERAIETDVGRIGSQPLDFDGAPGAVEFDDLVAQFLDDQVHDALGEVGGAGHSAEQFGFLRGVALFDARTIVTDCFDLASHNILLGIK